MLVTDDVRLSSHDPGSVFILHQVTCFCQLLHELHCLLAISLLTLHCFKPLLELSDLLRLLLCSLFSLFHCSFSEFLLCVLIFDLSLAASALRTSLQQVARVSFLGYKWKVA